MTDKYLVTITTCGPIPDLESVKKVCSLFGLKEFELTNGKYNGKFPTPRDVKSTTEITVEELHENSAN